jgi:hypothetical protein
MRIASIVGNHYRPYARAINSTARVIAPEMPGRFAGHDVDHASVSGAYPAGADENSKIKSAATSMPIIQAIRVHHQANLRPIIELHHFDGPVIEDIPGRGATSISIAVFSCSCSFLIVLARFSSFYAVLCGSSVTLRHSVSIHQRKIAEATRHMISRPLSV